MPLPSKFSNWSSRPFVLAGLIGFGCFVTGPVLYSQTVGNWNFNNTINGTAGTYNTVSVADFSAAIPTKAHNGIEYFGENGWPAGGINLTTYLEFTLTPVSGHALHLLSLHLKMRRSNTGSSGGSGPTAWSLRSSVDGYTTDITNGPLISTHVTFNIILSAAFSNLSTAVNFRIYGYTAVVSSGGLSRFVYDNVEVRGSDIILPEKISSLKALSTKDHNRISFTTGEGAGDKDYLLQRSINTRDFKTIHRFVHMQNNVSNYVYDDRDAVSANQDLYYRLAILRTNGSIDYSQVVVVRPPAGSKELTLTKEGKELIIRSGEPGPYYLRLTDVSGNTLLQRVLSGGENAWSVPLPAGISGFVYATVWNSRRKTTRSFVWAR